MNVNKTFHKYTIKLCFRQVYKITYSKNNNLGIKILFINSRYAQDMKIALIVTLNLPARSRFGKGRLVSGS